jgi:hypothetical protein
MDIHGFPRPGPRPGPRWTIRGARLQLRPGTLLGWQRFREEREQIERGHDVHLGNFLRGDLDLDISWYILWFHGSIHGHFVVTIWHRRHPSRDLMRWISGYPRYIYIWLNIPIHWLSKPLSLGRDALIDFFKCLCKIIQSTCSWDLPQWSSDHQWWMTGKQKVISLMPSDPPVTHPLFSALYFLIWFHVTNVGRTIINHPPNHHK